MVRGSFLWCAFEHSLYSDRTTSSAPSAVHSVRVSAECVLKLDHIRNFCIVAHIDHGKSTLADRLIEATGTLQKREMKAQVLDTLDLERERGITIKLNAVRMSYTAQDGADVRAQPDRHAGARRLHVRSVALARGVRGRDPRRRRVAGDPGADALESLPRARRRARDHPDPQQDRSAGRRARARRQEVHDLIGADPDDILLVSAKEGTRHSGAARGDREARAAARGDPDAPLRALIFDSYYDRYRGAIPSIRVVDGAIKPGMQITFGAAPSRSYEVAEVGYNQLRQVKTEELGPGEVGYVVANVRRVKETRAGDTVFDAAPCRGRAAARLPGRAVDGVRRALSRPTPRSTRRCATRSRSCSSTMPRCTTSPRRRPRSASASAAAFSACCTWRSCRNGSSASSTSISSRRCRTSSTTCTRPTARWSWSRTRRKLPDPGVIERIEEPYVKARIMAPAEYIGPIMTLGKERRGVYKNMTYLDTSARRVRLGVSARRDHPRLLRQAEDDQPRLRDRSTTRCSSIARAIS